MRTSFIKTLLLLAEADRRIWLICGDLGFSVLEPFASRFPDRFINAGVAEQNMTGIAAGLALSGKIVFTYSIANFPTIRCLEQIRNDLCYHRANVKIIAVGGGLAYGSQGYTHHGVEDLAVMRAMPGMAVAAPADPVETSLITKLAAAHEGPCYVRLGKSREEAVHTNEPCLEWGKAIIMRDGSDVALFSTGNMLKTSMDVSEILAQAGISAAVISMPFVEPFDSQLALDISRRVKLLASIEEHSIVGGLGSALAETLAEKPCVPLLRFALPREAFKKAGSQNYLRTAAGLDAKTIAERIAGKCFK